MVQFIDPTGKQWNVEETSRSGFGSRAPGDPLPEPTIALVRFTAAGEERYVSTGTDWRNAELLSLFLEALPRSREALTDEDATAIESYARGLTATTAKNWQGEQPLERHIDEVLEIAQRVRAAIRQNDEHELRYTDPDIIDRVGQELCAVATRDLRTSLSDRDRKQAVARWNEGVALLQASARLQRAIQGL